MSAAIGPGGVTVILPTYRERENLAPLLEELFTTDVQGLIKRVIVVDDDSRDGTSEFIKSTVFARDVLCLLRIGRKGLSSAVVEGILLADTPFVAVMDADGQHRPVDLMGMIGRQQATQAQLVVGSRFLVQAKQATHTGLRQRMSTIGNSLAQKASGTELSDPLTGFFLMDRELFVQNARRVHSGGFKILLEILQALRGQALRIEECQIEFRSRLAGESKLDTAVLLEFVEQLANHLTGGIIPYRFLGFALVGASGVAVHFAILSLLLFQASLSFPLSQTAATLTAIVWNYALNNRLTFRRNRRHGFAWFSGLAIYMLACGLGALANIGVASVMNQGHYSWWLSGIAGVIVGTVFNFCISRDIVWRD